MDLNYLLHRHQISLMRAGMATCGEAEFAHRGLADGYAARIAKFRAKLGASDAMVLAA
ncbi:hypothetical protein [Sphingomonas lenta]|uniref:hypothetical protein n=1 Tax=Sphingomonas lenta TaxID=1141887 RepID=UPI0015959EEA|nr:hypothetical protein [Sphingomonas lenta]